MSTMQPDDQKEATVTDPNATELGPDAAQQSFAAEDPAEQLSPEDYLERRSSQAMVATYLQMARYATLARALQRARLRSTQRRLDRTYDPQEAERLRHQLDAQRHQGANLDGAVARFRRRAADLRSFPDAGLSTDELSALGLDDLLTEEDQQTELPSWDDATREALTEDDAQAAESLDSESDDESDDDLGAV
jgi:hypothetical protein